MIQADTELYCCGGLKGLYDARIPRSLFRGLPKDRFKQWLKNHGSLDKAAAKRLWHLCIHGQQPYMMASFSPNGGSVGDTPIQNNTAYHTLRLVVEDNAARMRAAGRAVILDVSKVTTHDLSQLHVHTTFAVPKQGGLARVVTHCSYGSRTTPSYNESVDLAAHSAAYPRPTPPRLRDFADMLCRMRDKYPDCNYLHAAVVDAKSAFQLYHLSFEKFKLMWTTIQVKRGQEWVRLLVGNMCEAFGDLGAGDTWDVPASVWTALTNLASSLWDVLLYVDDQTIVAAPLLSDLPHRPREFYRIQTISLCPLSTL